MSGISVLIDAAIEFERTHQIVLFTLFEKSNFAIHLLGFPNNARVEWEPESQLFDLRVKGESQQCLLEIKTWSTLSENQRTRQTQYLRSTNSKAVYVLLATSWFEHTHRQVEAFYPGATKKVGYEELIDALQKLIADHDLESDLAELALAYRLALKSQFFRIKAQSFSSNSGSRLLHYSFYHVIQEKLSDIHTAIYTVNHPGGEVYILNNEDWQYPIINGTRVELYYELVNGRLCIKFFAGTASETKCSIRNIIRKAVRSTLIIDQPIIDSGRVGAYMTACQIEFNFLDLSKLEEALFLFRNVHERMPDIAKACLG